MAEKEIRHCPCCGRKMKKSTDVNLWICPGAKSIGPGVGCGESVPEARNTKYMTKAEGVITLGSANIVKED